jgi:hypothetical protein
MHHLFLQLPSVAKKLGGNKRKMKSDGGDADFGASYKGPVYKVTY